MHTLILQYNYNYWAEIWVYIATLAAWVCIGGFIGYTHYGLVDG